MPPRAPKSTALPRFLVIVVAFVLAASHGLALSPQDATGGAAEAPVGMDTPLASLDGATITRRDLLRRLAQRYRTTKEGEAAFSELLDNRIVEREMTARGVVVDAAAVDARYASFEKMMKDSGAEKTLAEELKERGVTDSEFRERLRLLVGLETLARKDFGVPDGEEIETAKQNLWLKTAREKAKVELPPSMNGNHVVILDGEPIPIERYGEEIEKALPEERLRESLNEVIGIRLVTRLMAETGVTVTDEDIRADVAVRKKQFESDPRFQGVPYEDYLKATRGAGTEAFFADPDFRSQVALKKIVIAREGRDAVKKRFEEKQDIYGPRVHVKHVFVQASDTPLPAPLGDGKTTRTFAEAEKLIGEAKKELAAGAEWKTVVSKYSEDATRLRDGDLGVFPERNRYGADFFRAAAAMKPAAISEPIRSQYGWHILHLIESRPAPPLEEVFERVLADIAGERYREAFNAASVEIFPAAPGAKSAKPRTEPAENGEKPAAPDKTGTDGGADENAPLGNR